MPFKSRRSQAAAENIAKRWKQQENINEDRLLQISTDDGFQANYTLSKKLFN
jgi:hypothetical protein